MTWRPVNATFGQLTFWKAAVNHRRASRAVGQARAAVIGTPGSRSAPQICARESENFGAPAANHRLHHVESETLGHLGRDPGRDRQFLPVDHRVHQHWTVMREGLAQAGFGIGRIRDADAACADRFPASWTSAPVSRTPADKTGDRGNPSRASAARRNRSSRGSRTRNQSGQSFRRRKGYPTPRAPCLGACGPSAI
jgi:hypothetical protein